VKKTIIHKSPFYSFRNETELWGINYEL
jgi:hypothetical protein